MLPPPIPLPPPPPGPPPPQPPVSIEESEERMHADMLGEHLNPDDFNAAEVENFSKNKNNNNDYNNGV